MAGRHYTPLGYCDVVDVENYLLMDIDESFEEQIEDWIATAEKQANKYMGYTTPSGVLSETITDEVTRGVVDTDSNLTIFPRKVPVTSITSISLIKGSDQIDLTLTTGGSLNKYNIPTTADQIIYPDYELETSGSGLIASFASLRNTEFFTKTTYVAGYSEVPSDIRQATINLVADIVQRHGNKEGLETVSQGRITKRYWARKDGHSDFYLDAMEMLKPYRIASRWL